MGTIFNIQKFCIHDGDGIRTTVFLKGCPLKCIWCHNPEGLSREVCLSFFASKCTSCGRCIGQCPARHRDETGKVVLDREKCDLCGKCETICFAHANELLGYESTPEEAFAEVLRDKMFYEGSGGGMTVSGGEPSYQPEFTLELLRLAKEAGIGRAIETCGIGTRDFYTKAADLGTTFLFDLKCMNSEKHKRLTGVPNEHIIDNLLYLFDRGADVRLRLPMIPTCNDSPEDIAALCDFLKAHEGKYRYAEIMPYHALGVGKAERIGGVAEFKAENATDADIDGWVDAFAAHGVSVKVSK